MPSTLNKVLVLCWQTPSASDTHAKMIIEFVGAEAEVVCRAGEVESGSIERLIARYSAVVVSASTLLNIAAGGKQGAQGLLPILKSCAHIFIYGFEPGQHDLLLRCISSGRLTQVRPLRTTAAFEVSQLHRESCWQFSGLRVKGVDPSRDMGFAESGRETEYQTLVQVEGQPFFVRFGEDNSEVFVVACGEIANLAEPVSCEAGLLPWFSRLVPLMIFVRKALGSRLWHSDLSQACFIVDDPLLKRRYGFLEFDRLLEVMNKERFSACIAFIPWNYRRSAVEVARQISAGTSLSMCIHGCDHTAAEFASRDSETLISKAQRALERMQEHARNYEVPFDDVMVFPQGLFSSEALKALEACGYLAAVNTDLCPTDEPASLSLRDLLDVAVTRFGGSSLFWRHYPKDTAQFAFDLFLGKPAFIVEHHGYFRNGYQDAADFMRKLSQLDERLEWQSPAAICSRACLKRQMPDGNVHVRFYTNRFNLTNTSAGSQAYVLFRKWSRTQPPRVTVNEREWIVQIRDDELQIELSLNPGETAHIQVFSELPAKAEGSWKPTTAEEAKVLVRRVLSEFRDDHVETHPLLRELLLSARKLRAARKAESEAKTILTATEASHRSGEPRR